MRVRILYVVDRLNVKGGIQSFAKSSSVSVSKKIKVNTTNWQSPLTIYNKALVFCSPGVLGERLYEKFLSKGIKSTLDESKYDIIHFWHVKSAMAAVNTIKLPYVVTCHGSEVLLESISSYQKQLFIRTLKGAVAIAANSNFTKNYLVQEHGIESSKIEIIHPGIDPNRFKLRNVAKSTKLVIGTLTRFVPRKNLPNIISALQTIHDDGQDFKFLLAGTGDEKIVSNILAKLRMVTFDWQYLGEITETQKTKSFYPSLNAFVLPPLAKKGDIEGFGIVYLEANASGVPVIAADTGGVSDAVCAGISGEFANPSDPSDIAKKILGVVRKRIDWKISCRAWSENFSQKNTGRALEDLYFRIYAKRIP